MSHQIIVELDEATARELEAVAPSRERKRSLFIRRALRKALDDAAEHQMAEAYRRSPDSEPALHPEAWEAKAVGRRKSRK